ncbi:hypothetical protein BDQ17DRAFT_1204365, partial [Cyathus striatus]
SGTKGGHPEDKFITENFIMKEKNKKTRHWTVECKYCSVLLIHRDGHCPKHFASPNECHNVPKDVQTDANNILMERGGGVNIAVSDSEDDAEVTAHPKKKQKVAAGKAIITTGMGSFVDRALTKGEQDSANTQLLRWFIHGNIPFNQADSHFFRKWVGNICPSYSPAS